MTTLELPARERPAQFSYKQHEQWPTEVWFRHDQKHGKWRRLTVCRSDEEARAMVEKLSRLP